MKKGNAMPNDVAIAREPIWKVVQTPASIPQESGDDLSRLAKFFIWLGVIMAQPDNPRGWGWNPAVITLCLVVLSIVASGAYYIGHLAAEVEFLKTQQQHTEAVAQDASKVAGFAVSQTDKGDGHKNSNSNTQEKK